MTKSNTHIPILQVLMSVAPSSIVEGNVVSANFTRILVVEASLMDVHKKTISETPPVL